MYLKRGTRVACWVFAVLGLFFVLMAVLAAAGEKGSKRGAALAGGALLAAIFLLPSGIPLLLYYTSQASRRVPHRDILRDHLHLDPLLELGGVQFTAIPFPDTVVPPSHVALAVFLQNCHDTPRQVEVRIPQAPVRLVDRQDPYRVRLEGGESGVLLILGFAAPDEAEGEHLVTYKVRATQPGPVGRRMIEKDGQPRGEKKVLTLVIRPPRALGETAGYAALADRKGYRTIFRPGDSAPNEESLDFLTLPT
jgi:hypothetical protein